MPGGNVMLQQGDGDQLSVRIIDFGLAQPFSTEDAGLNLRGFKSDVSEVMRLFSGLYTTQMFDNKWDIQHNYTTKLKEVYKYMYVFHVKIKRISIKGYFKMVVLIVEWSLFQGGLKAGFYCIVLSLKIYLLFKQHVFISFLDSTIFTT